MIIGKVARLDLAMKTTAKISIPEVPKRLDTGGIDLTPAKLKVDIKNDAAMGIKLHLDPAMLRQLQNSTGLVPVIISVERLGDAGIFNESINFTVIPK